MLDICPDNRRRGLRPHGQGLVLRVGKGVHLLFHNIRCGPYPPGKEFRMFQYGCANLNKTKVFKDIAHALFYVLPEFYFTGQDILEPAYKLYHFILPFPDGCLESASPEQNICCLSNSPYILTAADGISKSIKGR